jgi:3'-5' exoribonuclease
MNKVQYQNEVSGGTTIKGPWVSDLKPGQEFIGFYVARNPRLVPYRDPSNGHYLRLHLGDRTGTIQARIWKAAEESNEEIRDGSVIKIDGSVEVFREEAQVHIRRVRPGREGEFDQEDFMNASSRDPEQMWSKVQDAVRSVKDPHLASLLRTFYGNVPFTHRLLVSPAARVIHHSYMYGLLEHLYELLLLAEPLMDLYPEIDEDLLVAGILLHDIGKLEEYEVETDISVTDFGKLIGHVVLSERLVSQAIRGIEGFPQQLELEVIHLVISHHGRHEWGAARRPKSLEAIALHHLDNLDAQVNRFNLLLSSVRQDGKTWTDYDRMLGRMLYAGGKCESSLDEDACEE